MSISEISLNTEQLQILGIRRDAMNRNIRREEYTHHLGIDEFFSIYNTVSQIALLDTFKPYKLLPPDFDHEATLYRHVKPLFPILNSSSQDLDLLKLPINYIPVRVIQNLAGDHIRTVKQLAHESIPHLLAKESIGSAVALRVVLCLNHYSLLNADPHTIDQYKQSV